jgi:Tfp pilus assembly protein PilF
MIAVELAGKVDPAASQEATVIKANTIDLSGGAATLSNLGQILRRQGRVDEAEEAYKQALLTVDVGGDACRSIAVHVLNDYAAFLRERGREAEAKTHAARAAQLSAAAAPAAGQATGG